MSMVIGTNVASLTAQRHLADSRADMETAMERLSSGKRINSAMDDAAGLAITHKLDAKITSLNQATRNANDGISLTQVAEGAMEQVSDILNRMKEIAVQASNETYSAGDRDNMDLEFVALTAEIDRIAAETDFNGTVLLDGTNASVNIFVSDEIAAASDAISITLTDIDATALGLTTAVATVDTTTLAEAAITAIDAAIVIVDDGRSQLGADANRLDHAVSNLMNRSEHQSAARSRIEDADFAVESANLAKAQVLQQAGTAMLAQANASGQGVLSLLK